MNQEIIFKTVTWGGFDKQEVLAYIRKMNENSNTFKLEMQEQLNFEIESKNALENKVLQLTQALNDKECELENTKKIYSAQEDFIKTDEKQAEKYNQIIEPTHQEQKNMLGILEETSVSIYQVREQAFEKITDITKRIDCFSQELNHIKLEIEDNLQAKERELQEIKDTILNAQNQIQYTSISEEIEEIMNTIEQPQEASTSFTQQEVNENAEQIFASISEEIEEIMNTIEQPQEASTSFTQQEVNENAEQIFASISEEIEEIMNTIEQPQEASTSFTQQEANENAEQIFASISEEIEEIMNTIEQPQEASTSFTQQEASENAEQIFASISEEIEEIMNTIEQPQEASTSFTQQEVNENAEQIFASISEEIMNMTERPEQLLEKETHFDISEKIQKAIVGWDQIQTGSLEKNVFEKAQLEIDSKKDVNALSSNDVLDIFLKAKIENENK